MKLLHYITTLVAAASLLVLVPLTALATAAAYLAPDIFGPVETTLSLTLDDALRLLFADDKGRSSAFKAFIGRVRNHDFYRGGRFVIDERTPA